MVPEIDQNKQIVLISTHNIVHSCIDVLSIKYVVDIPSSICNKTITTNSSTTEIFITDKDHDYILDGIIPLDHIDY